MVSDGQAHHKERIIRKVRRAEEGITGDPKGPQRAATPDIFGLGAPLDIKLAGDQVHLIDPIGAFHGFESVNLFLP